MFESYSKLEACYKSALTLLTDLTTAVRAPNPLPRRALCGSKPAPLLPGLLPFGAIRYNSTTLACVSLETDYEN
jgi:hypothetical protein